MKSKSVFTDLFFFAALFAGFLACGPQRAEQLRERSRSFADDLRWKRVELAKTYLDKDVLADMAADLDAVGENLIITDAEIKHFVIDEDEKQAIVSIQFSWYIMPDVAVKKSDEVQTWKMVDNKWLLCEARGKLFPAIKKAAEEMREKDKEDAREENLEKERTIPKVYEKKPDI
ncbi:MAG: hypothetical protein Kow0090_18390 [Myxococcota bacterium]